jgi:hypothetical protein
LASVFVLVVVLVWIWIWVRFLCFVYYSSRLVHSDDYHLQRLARPGADHG